jgi:hypothetical protein
MLATLEEVSKAFDAYKREKQIATAGRQYAANFRKQRTLYLARLPKLESFFLASQIKEAAYDADITDIADQVSRLTSADVQAINQRLAVQSIKQGYTKLATDFGMEGSFTLAHPDAVAWARQHAAAAVTEINDTTRKEIQRLIADGIDAGKSYSQVAREIRGSGIFSVDRAQMIAVHENAMAYENGASMLIADLEETGLTMEKAWSTVGVDQCEICLGNETAGWIPNGDAFPSGDKFPPNHPRCRCTCLYQRQGTESGDGKKPPTGVAKHTPTPQDDLMPSYMIGDKNRKALESYRRKGSE